MKSRILLVLAILSSLSIVGKLLADEMTLAWIGCDGTVVSRTEVGQLQVLYTDKNLPGCFGPKWVDPTIVVKPVVSVTTGALVTTGTTLSGTISTGVLIAEEVSTDTTFTGYDPEIDGPLFDLAQRDIVAYRTELMKARQIQYANALRSVRMRAQATKNSRTEAYLMQNDAVVVTQSGPGWTGVQGATVSVTDTGANLVEADTTGKADGYIATKYLRDPNASDLVRIKQADQQFWSDIARVNVDYSVNVRAHPWYGAKILTVLRNDVPLYVVSTIDNWSEVINDDRTLHGYIRSDYLTIEKYQRVEVEPIFR
jgi:hypothetical protein